MKKIRWRKNVLTLVAAGYITIIIFFVAMAATEALTTRNAYEVVEAPLMALIGGSLALSKDLLDDCPEEEPNKGNNQPNSEG